MSISLMLKFDKKPHFYKRSTNIIVLRYDIVVIFAQK